MSLRFRFGRYRVDLAIPLAWLLAVPLGGALAYGVLLAVTKMVSLAAPHISLSLNAWFSTTVAYLLPATVSMAAAIICMLIPVFTSHQPSPPHDAEAFGHAIIPQAIANAAWVLVYSSAWGIFTAYMQDSGARSTTVFWLSLLALAALEVWQRATGARFSQSHAMAGRLRNFSTWLTHPGLGHYVVTAVLAAIVAIFIVPQAWSGLSSPPGSQENHIELVSLVLTASIALVSIMVAIVAVGLQVVLERRMTTLVKVAFQEPLVLAGAAWILLSIVFGYCILWFGPNSDLASAYLWVGVINLVILALGMPYIAQKMSFPELVRGYGEQVASMVTRRFTDPLEAALHLSDVRFWADMWILGRFRPFPPATRRAQRIQQQVAQSVQLLTEILRDGVRQDNSDTMQAALTSVAAIHAAYVAKLKYGRPEDDVIQALHSGLIQAWNLALNVHTDERVFDMFAEAIRQLCRDAATHVPREPRVSADIPWQWMRVAHDWFKDTIELGLMYTTAPTVILSAAEDTLVSLSESVAWRISGVLESLVEQYVGDTIPLIAAKVEGIYGAMLAGKCLSLALATGAGPLPERRSGTHIRTEGA